MKRLCWRGRIGGEYPCTCRLDCSTGFDVHQRRVDAQLIFHRFELLGGMVLKDGRHPRSGEMGQGPSRPERQSLLPIAQCTPTPRGGLRLREAWIAPTQAEYDTGARRMVVCGRVRGGPHHDGKTSGALCARAVPRSRPRMAPSGPVPFKCVPTHGGMGTGCTNLQEVLGRETGSFSGVGRKKVHLSG